MKVLIALLVFIVGGVTKNYTYFNGVAAGSLDGKVCLRWGYLAIMHEGEEVGGIFF